jgi:hypothetical protein
MESKYYSSLEEALQIINDSPAAKKKYLSYGTIIYTPPLDSEGTWLFMCINTVVHVYDIILIYIHIMYMY